MGETPRAANQQREQEKTVVILSIPWPLTYLIHIAEGYWLGEGYLAYLYRIRGVHMSATRFWIAQAVGTTLVIAGILIARQLKFLRVMLAVIGAIILVNGLTHIVTAISQKGYGPGLLSSIFLWIRSVSSRCSISETASFAGNTGWRTASALPLISL